MVVSKFSVSPLNFDKLFHHSRKSGNLHSPHYLLVPYSFLISHRFVLICFFLFVRRRHGSMFNTKHRENCQISTLCNPSWTNAWYVNIQAPFKSIVMQTIIKTVGKVKYIKTTACATKMEGVFPIVTLRVQSSQIPQCTIVLSFLIATSGWHIGLGDNLKPKEHTSISKMQPSLDPDLKRSDSSDVIMCIYCQRDATFAPSRKASEIQIVHMVAHILCH